MMQGLGLCGVNAPSGAAGTTDRGFASSCRVKPRGLVSDMTAPHRGYIHLHTSFKENIKHPGAYIDVGSPTLHVPTLM